MSFFSLVNEEESNKDLGDLFSKSASKDDPQYDYSEVDNKKKVDDEADDFSENDDNINDEDDQEKETLKAKEVKLKTDKMAMVKHEDTKKRIVNEEQEKRTIFVGNLSVNTKKPHLKKLFSKFGKIETIRFRCAGRPDMKTTKKVAVIKQTFHENRDNICAYIR